MLLLFLMGTTIPHAENTGQPDDSSKTDSDYKTGGLYFPLLCLCKMPLLRFPSNFSCTYSHCFLAKGAKGKTIQKGMILNYLLVTSPSTSWVKGEGASSILSLHYA